MYESYDVTGESCYRLLTSHGTFIYLRTEGYMEVANSECISSFICRNILMPDEEGERLLALMKDQYSMVMDDHYYYQTESTGRPLGDHPSGGGSERSIGYYATPSPSGRSGLSGSGGVDMAVMSPPTGEQLAALRPTPPSVSPSCRDIDNDSSPEDGAYGGSDAAADGEDVAWGGSDAAGGFEDGVDGANNPASASANAGAASSTYDDDDDDRRSIDSMVDGIHSLVRGIPHSHLTDRTVALHAVRDLPTDDALADIRALGALNPAQRFMYEIPDDAQIRQSLQRSFVWMSMSTAMDVGAAAAAAAETPAAESSAASSASAVDSGTDDHQHTSASLSSPSSSSYQSVGAAPSMVSTSSLNSTGSSVQMHATSAAASSLEPSPNMPLTEMGMRRLLGTGQRITVEQRTANYRNVRTPFRPATAAAAAASTTPPRPHADDAAAAAGLPTAPAKPRSPSLLHGRPRNFCSDVGGFRPEVRVRADEQSLRNPRVKRRSAAVAALAAGAGTSVEQRRSALTGAADATRKRLHAVEPATCVEMEDAVTVAPTGGAIKRLAMLRPEPGGSSSSGSGSTAHPASPVNGLTAAASAAVLRQQMDEQRRQRRSEHSYSASGVFELSNGAVDGMFGYNSGVVASPSGDSAYAGGFAMRGGEQMVSPSARSDSSAEGEGYQRQRQQQQQQQLSDDDELVIGHDVLLSAIGGGSSPDGSEAGAVGGIDPVSVENCGWTNIR